MSTIESHKAKAKEIITLNKLTYSLNIDVQSGEITGLFDNHSPKSDWISPNEDCHFGQPFINGTQESENMPECSMSNYSEDNLLLKSASKATQISYEFSDDRFFINYSAPAGCGPRAGLAMDLNLLDSNIQTDWQAQCMPTTIYTDPNCDYGYFIFSTADHRFMVMTVNTDFAAWRIKYSYEGHRMLGFQVLSQADDVITGERCKLKTVEKLKIGIAFAKNIKDCFNFISELLSISIAKFDVSGGFCGSTIPIGIVGNHQAAELIAPDGSTSEIIDNEVLLEMAGIYSIKTISKSGRVHTSRLLCHEKWESLFDKVNSFYMKNFQHDCGAFSRVIWKDTLSPTNGVTFEGVAFGDPEKMMSCRTGEFGGFCAWAMMKNCLLYGKKPQLMNSIDKYMLNWALNNGHEDNPYPGTIYKKLQSFLTREYGSYHLYHEVNYPQHEVFLLEQLTDYYKLTKNTDILEDIEGLGNHFINEHMNNDGCVICKNQEYSEEVDYCTVHVPVSALIRAANVVNNKSISDKFMKAAEKLADYVEERGLGFPTEGEPCTEDGSMMCSVITLLLGYMYISPKPQYLETAKSILSHHNMLEMNSTDCRMNGSSIRFWETQYETRDYGPSINAGHCWTIWTAQAKALMAQVCGDVTLLAESYNGFITNICKVDDAGGMPSCYTPDMIPGTPHRQAMYGKTTITYGEFADLRPTSTYLGMKYVDKTYAASGNHFLAQTGEIWSHISGISFGKKIGINGVLKGDKFKTGAVQFDCLLLDRAPSELVEISCIPNKEITIMVQDKNACLKVIDATIISKGDGNYKVCSKENSFKIS